MTSYKTDTNLLLRIVSQAILDYGISYGITMWRQGIKKQRNCMGVCTFGYRNDTYACAHCLEGGLRASNLFQQIPTKANCSLLRAADAVRAWSTDHNLAIDKAA